MAITSLSMAITSNEKYMITDDHDKEIVGATPTVWLFYTGVNGCPGRYFQVWGYCPNGWWESPTGDQYPVSKGLFEILDHNNKIARTKQGEFVWHDSLGLYVPEEIKGHPS